ncbi:MAG: zinc metalloprotease, partial [Myxococcaceae bacterium]
PAAVGSASSALVQAGGVGGIQRCGVRNPTAAEQDAIERDVAASRAARMVAGKKQDDKITVPVHFHIITTSTGTGDASSLAPAQIDVLNAAYARAKVKFRLASLEVVANDAWFTAAVESPEELEMKTALRRGDAHALNIYTGVNDGSLLGWATFPKSYKKDPLYDGVVLAFDSMPGGGLEFPFDPTQEPDGLIAYDRGDTATHEVGHWMGLFHTFEGGCSKNGDRIDDTPAEAEPQFFCVARDSCTGKKFPGFDPITNFMDYVDDDCMFEFTTDQEDRMRDQWETYRG